MRDINKLRDIAARLLLRRPQVHQSDEYTEANEMVIQPCLCGKTPEFEWHGERCIVTCRCAAYGPVELDRDSAVNGWNIQVWALREELVKQCA